MEFKRCENCLHWCKEECLCELVRGCIGEKSYKFQWCKDWELNNK